MLGLINFLIALFGILFIWATIVYLSGSYPLFLHPLGFVAACVLIPLYAAKYVFTRELIDVSLVLVWALLAAFAYEAWRKVIPRVRRDRRHRPAALEPQDVPSGRPVGIRIAANPDPEVFCGELRSRPVIRDT